MAKKIYYTEEEAAQKLGITPDELAKYVRDNKLRVFADGQRKMFKADEVDKLAAPSGSAEEIELSPADTGSATSVGLSQADKPRATGKEDTVITAEGISIFDDEDLEVEAADPMAKTHIAPSLADQVSLEGVGSGSGLLDLTRESDDTSLGAEVLDHIDMEGSVGSDIAPAVSAPEPYAAEAPAAMAAPVGVEEIDAAAGLFNGIIVGCTAVMIVLGAVIAAAAMKVVPTYLTAMKDNVALVLAGGAGIVVVAAVVGFLIGKAVADRQAAMRRVTA